MKSFELSIRYARALLEVAVEKGSEEKIFSQIRELKIVFLDKEILAFFSSRQVTYEEKKALIEKISLGFPAELCSLLHLLLKNSRLALFGEIVDLYEKEIDKRNHVCRGTVVSSIPLTSEEREKTEKKIEKVLGKKVVMTYGVQPDVLGGIVAQVGSYVFDDSLQSHMIKLKDQIQQTINKRVL